MTLEQPKRFDTYAALAAGLAIGATGILYHDVAYRLVDRWVKDPDVSHGLLVVLFSFYLLMANRSALRYEDVTEGQQGLTIGIVLLGTSLVMRMLGVFTHAQALEALSLLPFLIGVSAVVLGRSGAKWTTPSVLFLVFMIPLPQFVAGRLSGLLQTIATEVSTYSLQTLGIPALAEGNIITLTSGQIGVAEACSGLQMLYAFIALTVGACMIIDRTETEKFFIGFSAVPIAIMANCIRIVATGLVYEHADSATAQYIFHDLSGWLMVPLGFVILMIGLAILDQAIEPDEIDPLIRRVSSPAKLAN